MSNAIPWPEHNHGCRCVECCRCEVLLAQKWIAEHEEKLANATPRWRAHWQARVERDRAALAYWQEEYGRRLARERKAEAYWSPAPGKERRRNTWNVTHLKNMANEVSRGEVTVPAAWSLNDWLSLYRNLWEDTARLGDIYTLREVPTPEEAEELLASDEVPEVWKDVLDDIDLDWMDKAA